MGIPANHPAILQAIERGLIRVADLAPATSAPTPPQPVEAPKKARRKPVDLVAPAFDPPASWTIPVYVVAGDNARGMRSKIGRAGHERRAVFHALARHHEEFAPLARVAQAGLPLRCCLVRLGGHEMDSDGLSSAFKYVRDAVADFLGVTDGPRGPVLWEYAAEPGGAHGVRLELSCV